MIYQVHPYKTGGTSIRWALGITGPVHETAPEIVARVGAPAWDEAFTFTVVRNPFDRMVSWYEYSRRKKRYGAQGLTFAEYVRAALRERRDGVYNGRFFMPQREWVMDGDAPIVQYVGRFENLPESFAAICRAVGVSAALPHANRTRHGHYRDYYDAQTRRIVEDYYFWDLESFGYGF
jgi:hypothetical protein